MNTTSIHPTETITTRPSFNIDLSISDDEPLTEAESLFAAMYFQHEVSVARGIVMYKDRPEMRTTRIECMGWCAEETPKSSLFNHVGNDLMFTNAAIRDHLAVAVVCACEGCSERHLALSEALEHHAKLISCRQLNDNEGALEASRKRGELLHRAGFKNV